MGGWREEDLNSRLLQWAGGGGGEPTPLSHADRTMKRWVGGWMRLGGGGGERRGWGWVGGGG